MARKSHQKRKAKIKKNPRSSERGGDGELIEPDVSGESSDNQKPAVKLDREEITAETSDYSVEMAKFSCAVSCKTQSLIFILNSVLIWKYFFFGSK